MKRLVLYQEQNDGYRFVLTLHQAEARYFRRSHY